MTDNCWIFPVCNATKTELLSEAADVNFLKISASPKETWENIWQHLEAELNVEH